MMVWLSVNSETLLWILFDDVGSSTSAPCAESEQSTCSLRQQPFAPGNRKPSHVLLQLIQSCPGGAGDGLIVISRGCLQSSDYFRA